MARPPGGMSAACSLTAPFSVPLPSVHAASSDHIFGDSGPGGGFPRAARRTGDVWRRNKLQHCPSTGSSDNAGTDSDGEPGGDV